MGPLSSSAGFIKDPKASLKRVWNEIKQSVGGDPQLNLREAANLIGFHSYPLGWTWSEYQSVKASKTPSYELKARDAARLGNTEAEVPQTAGILALRNAEQFRRRAIQKRLFQILSVEQVRLIVFNSDGNGRIATQIELLEASLRFDIERSLFCIRDYRERAEVIASDLLTHLESCEAAWDVRKEQHDWLLAERLVRDFMAARGCNFRDQEIMRNCLELYTKVRPTFRELDNSEYARRIALLRLEHQPSDE
jgi:hypothetical protein